MFSNKIKLNQTSPCPLICFCHINLTSSISGPSWLKTNSTLCLLKRKEMKKKEATGNARGQHRERAIHTNTTNVGHRYIVSRGPSCQVSPPVSVVSVAVRGAHRGTPRTSLSSVGSEQYYSAKQRSNKCVCACASANTPVAVVRRKPGNLYIYIFSWCDAALLAGTKFAGWICLQPRPVRGFCDSLYILWQLSDLI